MLIQIFQNAPVWVWPLLALLVALGLSQRRDRSLTLPRATIVPLVMVCLSFYGVSSVFGAQASALLAWATGMALGAGFSFATGLWSGIRWSSGTRRLQVPGSWVPLVIILAIFFAKFVVGASLSMQPALRSAPIFMGAIGIAYGLLSGMFFGRGLAMWKAVQGPATAAAS